MKRIAFALAITVFASFASAAPLETYVLDAVGQSSYPTYSRPAPILNFFGPVGVGIPSIGLGSTSGVGGIDRLRTGNSGTITDAGAASGSGDSSFGSWTASGASSANASFGRVGAQGNGTRGNIGDGNTVVTFDAFGKYTEHWAFNDARLNGAVGTAVLHWRVDGSILSAGPSNTVGVEVNYQRGTDPIRTLMAANIQGTGTYFTPTTGAGFAGYSISPTAITGSGVFDTVPIDITFGAGFDFTLGLLAYSSPRNGTSSSTFDSTALLVGIDVYDALGQLVTDFSIVADSGTRYDANGVHFDDLPPPVTGVPAPETVPLVGLGLAAWWAARRGRRPTVATHIGGATPSFSTMTRFAAY